MSKDFSADSIPSRMDYSEAQDRIYADWESKGYFHANPAAGGTPFTIVIPPPNVTGALHLGHALNNNTEVQFVDCYQSLQREFVSTTPSICSTIVPGSSLWSTGHSRMILGPEMLRMQGMSNEITQKGIALGVSDLNMTDLAGNYFTGFVFAAAALAALVHAPLWSMSDSVLDSVACVLDM